MYRQSLKIQYVYTDFEAGDEETIYHFEYVFGRCIRSLAAHTRSTTPTELMFSSKLLFANSICRFEYVAKLLRRARCTGLLRFAWVDF